jgi:hypothetical protein
LTLVADNVDKVIETSSFDKISTFMHLISQTKIAFNPFYNPDDPYTQFLIAKKLIDKAIFYAKIMGKVGWGEGLPSYLLLPTMQVRLEYKVRILDKGYDFGIQPKLRPVFSNHESIP